MSIKVVVFGTSSFGLPSFEQVRLDPRFKIVGVVTQPARPAGRHQTLTASPVAQWSKEHHLRLLTPKTLRAESVVEELHRLEADIFLVASYGLILPPAALDLPRHGCLNIHASLLPKYRGASPISAAIFHGDIETGISFMQMDVGCDTGPIITQVRAPITMTDTRLTLEQRLSNIAAEEINQVLDDWCAKKIIARPQSRAGFSLAPRLTRYDGQAVWDDATRLERQVRAYQPWPGLWTAWNNTEMKILAATANQDSSAEPAGTIIQQSRGWGIVCRHGVLLPQVVQLAGKKPQSADQIPGSYPGFINSRLL